MKPMVLVIIRVFVGAIIIHLVFAGWRIELLAKLELTNYEIFTG